jgi:hypothetical protein
VQFRRCEEAQPTKQSSSFFAVSGLLRFARYDSFLASLLLRLRRKTKKAPVGEPFNLIFAIYSVFKRNMSLGLTRGSTPVRVKKTRQNQIIEPRF